MTSRTTAMVLSGQAVMMAALLTVALDQYAHAQSEMIDGVNRWGYRGAVARQRAYDETRIVTVGGTTAFEPGRSLGDTVAARVRYMTEQWVTFDRGPVTAFNIALPGLPRGAYASRLEQFRYLAPDLVCLFVDLEPTAAVPQTGFVTRLTNYVPALPAWVNLDRRMANLFFGDPKATDDITAIGDAVSAALTMAKSVVVAVPEPQAEAQRADYAAMMSTLSRFEGNPRIAQVTVKDGPPVLIASVQQPAAVAQIEPMVRQLLQRRVAPCRGAGD